MTRTTPSPPDTCVDCQIQDCKYEIRRRKLCSACLTKYIGSKALKRMEAYTFKNISGNTIKHRLFLPLSGGVSSLALLEILDAHQLRQIAKQNRVSFDLIVGHVDLTGGRDDLDWYRRVEKRYRRHTFLSALKLDDVLNADPSVEQSLKSLGLERASGEEDDKFLNRLFLSASSPTTRMDLQQLLLKRLLFATAKTHQCAGIVWGHSDSRLAALVLSDVAKGRGGSVTTTIADGSSPAGLDCTYPLRDLFKSELEIYLAAIVEPLTGFVGEPADTHPIAAGSVRNTAMDTLLTQYITSQGEKYPSIMANVVRTTGKLHKPSADQTEVECRLCLMPILKSIASSATIVDLCQGCQRIKQDMKV